MEAFGVSIESKGDATPEQLEAAWYEELARLQEEPVPAEELQKVKNQIAADAFRRLESPFFLMLQLVFYDGLGDWTYLNDWADRTMAVTAGDVQRVAREYFEPRNRVVGLYYREEGSVAESFPPGVAELPAEMQGPIQQQIRQLRQVDDPAQLEQIRAQIEAQKGQVPPEMQPAMEILLEVVQERIGEVSGSTEEGE